ncbi:MAG: hypothetical protein ACHQT9_02400 [Candidatus Saccharimonadales bacterium]
MAKDKIVSGEEYRAMSRENHSAKKYQMNMSKNAFLIIGAIILLAVGFFSGVSYQKSQKVTASSSTTATNGFAGGGAAGGRFRNGGGFGQVTAVDSSSISIQNPRSGTTKTYTIDSSTKITDSGQSVSTSDIQVGSIAFVSVSSPGSTSASSIDVNPTGGPSAGSGVVQSTPVTQ